MPTNNKKALFWTSYSDLMTSLFFAMLALFVVIVVAMGSANRQLKELLGKTQTEKEQLDRILRLQDQFETLTSSSTLEYDEEKRMFYAKDFEGVEIFEPNKDIIKEEYVDIVNNVGKDIKTLIESLNKNNREFKYQLVIEGTAAIRYKELKAKTYDPDNEDMYNLSYKRALALYKKWKHLNLRDRNTEIIIAGSGFNGINRDEIVEDNNKRFVIQIIPKIDRPSSY